MATNNKWKQKKQQQQTQYQYQQTTTTQTLTSMDGVNLPLVQHRHAAHKIPLAISEELCCPQKPAGDT